MSIKSIPIEEASAEQCRAFARDFLNLELAPEASDDDVASAIARAQPGGKLIFIQEAPTPEEANEPDVAPTFSADEQARIDKLQLRPEERGRPGAGSLGKGDPRALITIPVVDTEDETGSQDVLVGVNGRAWQLRRGEELNVPWRVVEALKNAIGTNVRHDDSGDETRKDVKRIPFQILEAPSEEAIARWHEETDALFCA